MVDLCIGELERIGAGREAEVFALEEGRVLRLARHDGFRQAVEREHVALLAARRCGAPAPAVYERLDVDGRPGLVLERLRPIAATPRCAHWIGSQTAIACATATFIRGTCAGAAMASSALIDWKAAARGDPAGDVATTQLLLLGAWIPGAGPRSVQLLLRPLRRLLYEAYVSAYERRRSLARAAIEAWVPVLAAARLSYDIAQERAQVLRLARRRLAAAR